jgi:hypothetical protein
MGQRQRMGMCAPLTIIDAVWLEEKGQGGSMPNAQWCHCMERIEVDGSSCEQYIFCGCFLKRCWANILLASCCWHQGFDGSTSLGTRHDRCGQM